MGNSLRTTALEYTLQGAILHAAKSSTGIAILHLYGNILVFSMPPQALLGTKERGRNLTLKPEQPGKQIRQSQLHEPRSVGHTQDKQFSYTTTMHRARRVTIQLISFRLSPEKLRVPSTAVQSNES